MSRSAISSVFPQLDELCATSHIAPGLQGTIFRIVDGIQSADTAEEDVRIAECISVALIRLQYAVRDADEEGRNALIEQVRKLKDQWTSSLAPGLPA